MLTYADRHGNGDADARKQQPPALCAGRAWQSSALSPPVAAERVDAIAPAFARRRRRARIRHIYTQFTSVTRSKVVLSRLPSKHSAWKPHAGAGKRGAGMCIYTQFTCFIGTEVQSLTLQASAEQATRIYTQFTCFPSTKVQILTRKWRGAGDTTIMGDVFKVDVAKWHAQVLSLLALLRVKQALLRAKQALLRAKQVN